MQVEQAENEASAGSTEAPSVAPQLHEAPPSAGPSAPDAAPAAALPANGAKPGEWIRQAIVTVLAGLLFAAVLQITVQNYVVEGPSMLPTVQSGDRVLVDRLAYKVGSPRRGDVVVFRNPPQLAQDYNLIKRVIGLPGDTVSISPGQVTVNGQVLKEPYLQPSRVEQYSYGPSVVPAGQYFVLGDNRPVSFDSHSWGFLPAADIYGRVMVAYWPLADFHLYGL